MTARLFRTLSPGKDGVKIMNNLEQQISDLLHRIGEILLANDAAIFFADKPGRLWIGGDEVGTIDHDPDECGHTFIARLENGKEIRTPQGKEIA